MKKFLQKILGFVLIPLFIIVALEIGTYIWGHHMFKENSLDNVFHNESAQYSWINTIGQDSIVVLAGSSSVRYDLSCKELNTLSSNQFKFVNIAMDARDPIATYFIIKNMNLKKVSAIYFGLDPWIYTKRYYMNRNMYMYLDFNFGDILLFSKEHDKSALIKRYKSLATFMFSSIFSNKKKSNNVASEVPIDYGSVALDRHAVNFDSPVNNWFQIDKYGWSDLQFIYLKKLMNLCVSKNVKFGVFIPPKRSDYSYIYQNDCKFIHNEFVSKLMFYGITAPIFGQFDQFDSIGDSIYFADAYHLNREGQKKYSELFYNMMQNDKTKLTHKYDWFSKNNKARTHNKGYMQ
ncbi:MAG: hypothetical protein IPH11_07780 [Ignavibacteriales bacterium]|nr:hypothetical protein [Ignavibacteriales bacterium]